MHILGISTVGRGSAVALLDDSSIQFAIEEEKLNRLQDSLDIPRLAIARCLQESGLRLCDLQAIAIASRVPAPSPRRKRSKPTATEDQLRQLLRGGPRPSHSDHHSCHAASAYYASGLDRALILSLDQGTSAESGLLAMIELPLAPPVR